MTYYDLGTYSLPITTDVADAQTWFDRGLIWTYGYNHNEAVACFQKAAEADPTCAMAYWGIAYASGPNYNMPWELYDNRGRAKALAASFDAAQEALARRDNANAVEQALIDALAHRYPQRDLADDMQAWDQAFADAMQAALLTDPDHLDLRAIAAESLLNLAPWKLWDLKAGTPADGAPTLLAQDLIETGLAQPGGMAHPGLLHFYVHLMEMSPTPEKALKAGDALRTLCPDAGHLVHMPTHIDVLCGDYISTVYWNQKAVEADLKYYEREGPFNIYTGYRQHNYHFVIYGALFLGQMEPALEAVRGLRETTPDAMMQIESPPMADFFEGFMAMEPHVLLRFGRWQEALEMELPEDQTLWCTLTATILYVQAVAHAALGDVAAAEAKEQEFLAAKAKVPATRLLHNNKVVDLLDIAAEMARGEIEYRKGNYEAAYSHLRASVALDDALPYDEPWGWMQPARHALGALLFEQGHVAEAEAVYREDLGLGGQLSRATVHPDNVWSLKGLHDCLKARGDSVELPMIKQKLDIALARADRAVGASCFCAQSAMKAAE